MSEHLNYELAIDTWGDEEREAIKGVIDSGQFTMGSKVLEFESYFAEYFGRKHAVMVNSGSSANLIGVASLFFRSDKPLKRGDEVIVPAISWSTTYSPLQQYGLKVKFVDVELESLNMDVRQLDQALSNKTRMIIGVNILGNPAKLDVIKEFANKNELIFFEDNCESMDAELNGVKTGSYGHIGTFSTFFSHHISTVEGGIFCTDCDELNTIARSIRAHGWTRDLPENNPLVLPKKDSFNEEYRFIFPGYNVRPQELNAAIGIVQLRKLPDMTRVRRENHQYFQDIFSNSDHFIIQKENGISSSFSFSMIIRPSSSIDRNKLFKVFNEEGIKFRMITGGCFPRHDAIRYFDYEIVGKLENSNLAHDRGFFVGNQPFDIRDKIDRLRSLLNKFVL